MKLRNLTPHLGLLLFVMGCATGPSSKQSKLDRNPAYDGQLQIAPEEQHLAQYQEQTRKNYFDWPVDDARMTRGYLPNRRKPHLGLDLAAPKGSPIYAAHDGLIIYAGRDFKGYGKMVLIEGAQGWATLYGHFSKINVREGQRISQGEQIGQMGRTGRATGVHLHFEIRKEKGPVDPLYYLPGGNRLASR